MQYGPSEPNAFCSHKWLFSSCRFSPASQMWGDSAKRKITLVMKATKCVGFPSPFFFSNGISCHGWVPDDEFPHKNNLKNKRSNSLGGKKTGGLHIAWQMNYHMRHGIVVGSAGLPWTIQIGGLWIRGPQTESLWIVFFIRSRFRYFDDKPPLSTVRS